MCSRHGGCFERELGAEEALGWGQDIVDGGTSWAEGALVSSLSTRLPAAASVDRLMVAAELGRFLYPSLDLLLEGWKGSAPTRLAYH